MTDLEKKLCDLLHELPHKRGALEELQQRHNEEVLRERELRAELEVLRAEDTSLKTQLEFTNEALRKCEGSYTGSRDSAVKHRLHLEAATKTIAAMKEQAAKLHLDNERLKKQVEDLEREVKAASLFRRSCSAKQAKTQEVIETLTTQMKNLEKDHRETERHAKEAISIGNKSKLMLEHKDLMIAQLQSRAEGLSRELVSLTSEHRNPHEDIKERKSSEQDYIKEILQEWQTSMSEMKVRNCNYESETETLKEALQQAIEAQAKLETLDAASRDRCRELEMTLEEAKSKKRNLYSDCSVQTDLNISIDVACETKAIQVEHISTQTDAEFKEKKEEMRVLAVHELGATKKSFTLSSLSNHQNLLSTSILNDLMSQHQLEKEVKSQELPGAPDLIQMPNQVKENVNTADESADSFNSL